MFLEDDELWMDEALRVAADGLAVTELPIGAVVVHDGAIIAAAYAQERTQGRLLVHADFLALDAADRLLGRDRREAKLYVTLEPCLGCLEAAMTAMIGGVVYALASPIDGAGSFAMEWDKTRSAQDFPGYRLPHIRAVFVRVKLRRCSGNTLSARRMRLLLRGGRSPCCTTFN